MIAANKINDNFKTEWMNSQSIIRVIVSASLNYFEDLKCVILRITSFINAYTIIFNLQMNGST